MTSVSDAARTPAPVMGLFDGPMWSSIREGAMQLQRCQDCGKIRPAAKAQYALRQSRIVDTVDGRWKLPPPPGVELGRAREIAGDHARRVGL